MGSDELIANLAQRVRKLEDIEEIKTLRNLYHHYVNDGKYESIRELFTEDAVVHLGYIAHYEGVEAIHNGFSGMRTRDRFFIKQFIHSHTVYVDGDRGTGFAYLEARYVRLGKSFNVGAKYDDIYVRQNGKWLFQLMSCEFYYTAPIETGWWGPDIHQFKPAVD